MTKQPSQQTQQTQEYEIEYRSTIQPRTATRSSTRSSGTFEREHSGGGGRTLKMVTEMGGSMVGGISPAMSANATQSFLQSTEQEKKAMQNLNDRLGNYIDRVKGLEAQNRKVVTDLEDLRGRWGKETSDIKLKYADNLADARKNIDEGARQKAEIDVKTNRLTEDINETRRLYEDENNARQRTRDQIEQYTNQLEDAKRELELLRSRFGSLQNEGGRYAKDNAKIWEELNKARRDLDDETLSRIDFQNQTQTLMEEIEFLRRVHDQVRRGGEAAGRAAARSQEVKELQALLAREPADTREYFKSEVALAIRDIKDEYDMIGHQNKSDMESWYKLKVSEVQSASKRQNMESTFQRDEVKRMRDGIGDLRGKLGDLEGKNAMLEKQVQELTYTVDDDQRQYEAALNDRDNALRRMREECQALVGELQSLLDTKQMLDAEIAIYRKMLEGEESRAGLRQMVEQVVKSHSLQQQEDTESTRSVRGETTTRTTFQRSAKGNVSITECDPDGKFITIENTHRSKDEAMGEWKLRRKLDNRKEVVYTLPENVVLKAGRTVKVWARDCGGKYNPPTELIFDGETNWGVGQNVVTTLVNKEGEERASHTQKTVQKDDK